MKKMKTRYSKPSVIVIQTAPVALLNTSIHTNFCKEGNAQTMAASRESNSSWDDEE